MRFQRLRPSATTGSRSRQPGGRIPSRGRTDRPQRGRSGSPWDTRPATRTSATPFPRAILGRRATAVDDVAERYLATYAALDPCAATDMGIVGGDVDYDTDITD